jgi:AbrB family looped-hinge helix DNA binding protein
MRSFEVIVTSRGEITIPARLRARLNLKPGDTVEFYIDRSGGVFVRPRNASPSAVFENAPKRKAAPGAMTDDEAIAAAVLRKDRRSRSRRGRANSSIRRDKGTK